MSDSEQTERIAQYDPNQDTLLDSEFYPFSLRSLDQQIEYTNSIIPEDEDKAFVGSYDVDYNIDTQASTMRVFFSTKRLIKMTELSEHIAADPT